MDAELTFRANPDACIGCGKCVQDCVAGIIRLEEGKAAVPSGREDDCIGCQHCLAVCPTAAVSVMGRKPADSLSLVGFTPDAANLETLVRGRRSVRRFSPEPVPAATLERVLAAAAYAPTGVNARRRRFTVVREAAVMNAFRERLYRALADSPERLPEEAAWLGEAAGDWISGGADMVFRDAPHLLITSVEKDSPCSDVDAVIAISYFDLLAQANGVGTVWCGMVDAALRLIPECREWLDIPADHVIGYAMLFGLPAVHYARTAQHEPEDVVMVSALK